MKDLFYQYQFHFNDRPSKSFTILVDGKTLACKSTPEHELPEWTKLAFNQCPGCPLDEHKNSHCPLAVNLVPIIYWCADLVSYDEVDIQINSDQRETRVKSSLQKGLSSLLGLLMSTSDCPEMKFLRPMARFHLPLATQEETLFRSVSMFLLMEYLQQQMASEPHTLSLQKLKKKYKKIDEINKAIVQRLYAAINGDAAVNAVVLLDIFSKMVSYSIDESLEKMRYLAEAVN